VNQAIEAKGKTMMKIKGKTKTKQKLIQQG
jgi:hypothetical protein